LQQNDCNHSEHQDQVNNDNHNNHRICPLTTQAEKWATAASAANRDPDIGSPARLYMINWGFSMAQPVDKVPV
jgi:hypothetical protein